MTNTAMDKCIVCLLVGRYVSWALLIFGGVVGGLSFYGFPAPSPAWERSAAYLMAFSLLIFAVSYLLMRLLPRHSAR